MYFISDNMLKVYINESDMENGNAVMTLTSTNFSIPISEDPNVYAVELFG